MIRGKLVWALAILTAGCGAAQERPEPPSGAVDPGVSGLVTPGNEGAARSPSPRGGHAGPDPGTALLGGVPGALPAIPHAGAPSSPAAPSAPAAPTGEATGAIVMTREHCDTLGRKFAELTMAQLGGGTSGIAPEAAEVGRTFADKCAHDMVGQTVDVREYQCMLRAKAADELLGCKR